MTRPAIPVETKLDFIVIGAQKAGTTSLFEYMRRHPELHLPPGKEKPFFSHNDVYSRGWEEYAADVFFEAPPDRLWGKATPWYMAGGPLSNGVALPDDSPPGDREAVIPSRIRSTVPSAKLIAILRDPVARCVSHYRMRVLAGQETRPFDQAVAELLTPEALADARRFPERASYVTWGEYGRILSGYYEVFPADQILVTFTDELEQRPTELLARIFRFLGADSAFTPANLDVRYRKGGAARRIGWLRSPSELEKAVVRQPVVRSIWGAVPRPLQARIELRLRELNYRLELWNRRGGQRTEVAPSTLAALREHYEEDRERLERLIGSHAGWARDAA
jgi:sulfotransferase family protein